MRLIRNTNPNGQGKYALLELEKDNLVEFGKPRSEGEFFVLKLKDIHARPALQAYANSIRKTDPEFAKEVDYLADRAGSRSPWMKQPD